MSTLEERYWVRRNVLDEQLLATTVASVARMPTMGSISEPGLLTESSCLGRAGIDAETGSGIRGERLCASVLATAVASA